MWTAEHRLAARRVGQRYDSDLTDEEWRLCEPMIPPPKRGGGKRTVNIREVLNGIFYVLWTGCQWKALPKDLRPRARCTGISCSGTGTARWNGCITCSTWRCASRKDARPVR